LDSTTPKMKAAWKKDERNLSSRENICPIDPRRGIRGGMASPTSKPIDMKLEVVVIPVSDVDRAKAFYQKLGFRLDIDYVANPDRRVVQLTPPGSEASIHIGKGITSATPGSVQNLYLIVSDIERARADLVSRGIDVLEVFHYDGLLGPRVTGPDPKRGTYASFTSFKDPDGNSWLLQEISARLPGREWKSSGAGTMDDATLAELLHETERNHGQYEKTHPKHNWWNWYAPYLNARQNGKTSEEAAVAAGRFMDGVPYVPPR
jgi:catechol 2,3-dioxygenase-like lactoylglutathione lyase family enzyme